MLHKILVTGGAGFIGRHLVRRLLEGRHDPAGDRLGGKPSSRDASAVHVLNLDKLTYAADVDALNDLRSTGRYDFAQIDLCDAERVRQVVCEFAPHAIFHLAAESHVDRSIDGPDDFVQSNIVGTYHLLQAARMHLASLAPSMRAPSMPHQGRPSDPRDASAGVFRFVHVSTDEVFGSLDFDQPGFTESSRYNPRSPYSASKAASDHLVRAWHHTYGLPVIVTHGSNNYGPGQHTEKLIPTVVNRALAGQIIPVYGDGRNVRDWIHVSDHVEGLCAALEYGEVGQSYGFGGNWEQSNIDLVRQICSILDRMVPGNHAYADQIQFVSDRPGHDRRYAINTTKSETTLHWRPEVEGTAGLESTVRWYCQLADRLP